MRPSTQVRHWHSRSHSAYPPRLFGANHWGVLQGRLRRKPILDALARVNLSCYAHIPSFAAAKLEPAVICTVPHGVDRLVSFLFSRNRTQFISPSLFCACLRSNVEMGKRVEESENIQQPENDSDDDHCVQDGLDRSLHRYEAVDQPKQESDHD